MAPGQRLTVTETAVSISPASLTLNRGETATFTASGTLSPPPTFQWSHDGTPVPGATAASLVIPNMQASDAGDYSCAIEQADPPMTAFAKAAKLLGPIVLQTNHQFISARAGSNVTFQVAFTGAAPTYLQ